MKKSIFKSKTFWMNVIMAVIMMGEGLKLIEGFTLPIWLMPVILLVSNTALRFITDTPVGLTDE